jgi:hypothetical protein
LKRAALHPHNVKMVFSDEIIHHLETLVTATNGTAVEVTGKNSKYKGHAGVVTKYTPKMAYVTLVNGEGGEHKVRLSKKNIRKIPGRSPSSLEEAVLDVLPEVEVLLDRLAVLLASARLTQAPMITSLLQAKLLNAATELTKTHGPYFDYSFTAAAAAAAPPETDMATG